MVTLQKYRRQESKSLLFYSVFHTGDTKERRLTLLSDLLLCSSHTVKGVLLGAELWHLHRRQVHCDGLRGQEGHRLWGQLLARRRGKWSVSRQKSALLNTNRNSVVVSVVGAMTSKSTLGCLHRRTGPERFRVQRHLRSFVHIFRRFSVIWFIFSLFNFNVSNEKTGSCPPLERLTIFYPLMNPGRSCSRTTFVRICLKNHIWLTFFFFFAQ